MAWAASVCCWGRSYTDYETYLSPSLSTMNSYCLHMNADRQTFSLWSCCVVAKVLLKMSKNRTLLLLFAVREEMKSFVNQHQLFSAMF